MERSHLPLLEQLAAWPATPAALRPTPAWADDPVLGRFLNGARASEAAASDPAVFAALAARARDQTATSAALAVVASRLVWVTRHRRHAGGSQDDLADTEASLAAEALACMRDDPRRPADAIAQTARHRVHNQRRTNLARACRQVPLPDSSALPSAHLSDPLRQALTVVTDAIAAGTLTAVTASALWATTCGWPSTDASRAVGCSPVAWRARRSRAARALRAALEGGRGR